ncbi:MAG: hypothetical protein IK076_05620 [Bacteroidales bacterium]|nr:hypothetical protein [Bacteroidales bacterium]
MKRILAIIILMSVLAACDRTLEPDSSFVAGSGIQLKVNGSVVHTYDPLTWQLGYNPAYKEFRASDDAMRNWFFVTCSAVPSSVGQKLEATVTWATGSSSQSFKGKFEVAKVQGDTYWLWCGDNKTPAGVTVRVLR